MKIGFFGNANNSPFMIARALRRLGNDVLFIIDRSPTEKWEILNRPENAYEDITIPYPDWIFDASPLDLWEYPGPSVGREQVVRLLNQCDLVVLNEFGLSLGPDIGKPTVALLTGTDLVLLADFSYAYQLTPNEPTEELSPQRLHYLKLIEAQRSGIRAASAIVFPAKGFIPQSDMLLEEIGVQDWQRIYFHMTDLEKIDYCPPPCNVPLRVLCMARLTWKKPDNLALVSEFDYKGTDVMVKGIGMFWRVTGIPLDIRLIRKGLHIEETIALIEAEGLSSQVTWLDEMSQIQVLEENRQADIIFEQLGNGVFGLGCVDAMAIGRPVIANGRPDIVTREFGCPMPICQATSALDVCTHLQKLAVNPTLRAQIGKESRLFVEKYFSPEGGAQRILQRVFDTLEQDPDDAVAAQWRKFHDEHLRRSRSLQRMQEIARIKVSSAQNAGLLSPLIQDSVR